MNQPPAILLWQAAVVDGIDKRRGIDRKFPRYGEYDTLKEFTESDLFKATTIIYDNAHAVATDLEGKKIPAADLTNEQKCALFTLAGFMEYRDGKMVSIRPVGISDRGDGGYILAIAPETKP